MDINRAKRVCKCLMLIWLALLYLIGMFLSVRLEVQDSTANSNTESISMRYQVFAFAYVLFCSTPLLFAIRKYAKMAGMKIGKVFANIMILQHIVWMILFVLEIVFKN